MNLKEAFHYQNALGSLIATAQSYLNNPKYVTKVTQEHMRMKFGGEDDETKDATTERPYSCSTNELIGLMMAMIDERHRLALAIDLAKRECGYALDANLATNRARQQCAQALVFLSRMKPSERITYANGYRFNVEGNQMPYRYDVKETTELDFDRGLAKMLAKQLNAEANEISKQADRCMIEVELKDFEPMFDADGGFDDAIDVFLANSKQPEAHTEMTTEQEAYEQRYQRHAV